VEEVNLGLPWLSFVEVTHGCVVVIEIETMERRETRREESDSM
jgi:hypothetical protein